MITRNLFKQIKPFFNKFPLRAFTTFKVDSLKNVLRAEIKHEETNYAPVDKNELTQFFESTKFQFKELENSTKMELRKVENNVELVINFSAKPPSTQPEAEAGAEGEEEQCNFCFYFMFKIIRIFYFTFISLFYILIQQIIIPIRFNVFLNNKD